jgi:hypothetical protein
VTREADKYEHIRAQSDPERARAKWFDSVTTSGHPIWAVEGGTVSLMGEHNAVLLNPPSYATCLQRQVCIKGVSVVVGRSTSHRTLMNKSETFLLTDYAFSPTTGFIRPAEARGVAGSRRRDSARVPEDDLLRALRDLRGKPKRDFLRALRGEFVRSA